MALFYFGNIPLSVPPVLDTSPCMKQMLNYQDCVIDANVPQLEVLHPQWPSVWPRLQTDGKLLVKYLKSIAQINFQRSFNQKDFDKVPYHPENIYNYTYMRPLTKKNKQYLYECEEERFVFKACLRSVLSLKKTAKHTSWNTAEVANLQFT